MEIPANCPTRDFSVKDTVAQIPQPFEEGHPCNEHEASALNQVLVENVRNNLRKKAEDLAEKGELTPDALQKLVDEYIAGYQMGAKGGGGPRIKDPVEAQALSMAETILKRKLKEQGYKLRDISASDMRQKCEELLDRHPRIRERAQAVVAEEQELARELEG